MCDGTRLVATWETTSYIKPAQVSVTAWTGFFSVKGATMCKHQYEYEGFRSFGDNIPGYAQGAYFPGDEPGTRCKLTGKSCGNVCGDTPEKCVAAAPTDWLCPKCRENDYDILLWLSKEDEEYFCTMCKSRWTADELPHAYTTLLISLRSELNDAMDDAEKSQREAKKLREKLESVRTAIMDVSEKSFE